MYGHSPSSSNITQNLVTRQGVATTRQAYGHIIHTFDAQSLDFFVQLRCRAAEIGFKNVLYAGILKIQLFLFIDNLIDSYGTIPRAAKDRQR